MSVYDEEKLLIKPCFIKMQNSLNANIRSKVQKTKIIKTKVVVGLSLSLSFFLSLFLSLSISLILCLQKPCCYPLKKSINKMKKRRKSK